MCERVANGPSVCSLCIRGRRRRTRRALAALQVALRGKGHSKNEGSVQKTLLAWMWIIRLNNPPPMHTPSFHKWPLCAHWVLQHWPFHFSIPLCTTTKASNYPISGLSLHPTQKTQMPRKLRESQDLTNIICFFIFSWLLFCLSRTVNSPSNKQYRLYVWTELHFLLACGKYQHYNYQFNVANRRKGHCTSFCSVLSFSLLTTFQDHCKVLKYTDKETFILTLLLFARMS